MLSCAIICIKVSPFFSNTSLKLRVPLSDCRISDGVVEVIARFNNVLSQLVDMANVKIFSVHGVLHYTLYLIIHQVKRFGVLGGPSSWRDEVEFPSLADPLYCQLCASMYI